MKKRKALEKIIIQKRKNYFLMIYYKNGK